MSDATRDKKMCIEGDMSETASELGALFGHSPGLIDRALLRFKVELYASLEWNSDCHAAVKELRAQHGDHSKDHYILACDDCQREEQGK